MWHFITGIVSFGNWYCSSGKKIYEEKNKIVHVRTQGSAIQFAGG